MPGLPTSRQPASAAATMLPDGARSSGPRAPNRYSVRSPGIVDHESPGAVRLTPQDIRRLCSQRHRLAVCPRAVERPRCNNQGQIADLENAFHVEVEFSVHRDETAKRFADAQ